jgi:O-succinylhomoserine sulfhydrylase
MDDNYHLDTLAVRAGQERSQFGEHSEALYLTSSFVFKSAAHAAARFSGAEEGMVYARFTNPTVDMLQKRLAALEGAERCVATASGMAAILATAMALLKAGDHIVASNGIFGATQQLFGGNILGKFGIETSLVAATDLNAYRAAVKPNTKLFFIETPSNPLTEIVDIAAVAEIAHAVGALLVVDNCFCTPVLQKPLELGADLVIHSATKYLDGQGRVLGGAVCGGNALVEEVFKFLRTAGPTLSPFNAWIILKGLETLRLRMEAQSAAALKLAQWLEAQPQVARVFYPGLASHPQHALAMRQQKSGGAIVSFEVKGERAAAWRVIDSTRLLSITANLGDTKTTITHPASTTHGRISAEARAASGITEGLLRVAVGLEDIGDIEADLARGLGAN